MKRIAWQVLNTSTGGETISIGVGKPAVSLQGLVAYPQDPRGESNTEGYECSQDFIEILSSGAGGTCAFFERVVPDGS
jgi:hypothetical protein